MVGHPPWLPLTRLAVVAVVVGSLLTIGWLDRSRGVGFVRRRRLLMGIPWGTLVSIGIVLVVYLFVQGAWGRWYAPVVIPFRSWSYFYPVGMVLSGFAHSGVNHLTGNLIGALVLGSLAEFAWGHFPTARGDASFSTRLTNPYVRAFIVVPGAVVITGITTSLFSWGPVIGFSGVVFALAGFAFVRYPLLTVVALTADDVVRVLYRAFQDPVVVARAEPSFGQPWWAGIAVQGHLLGLFLGLTLGAVALRGRKEPSATRRWIGAILVAGSLSLWALWWFRGNGEFVLYRGLGVVFIAFLAVLITGALRAIQSERSTWDVPWRAVGIAGLLLPILVVGFVAVPLNLGTGAQDNLAETSPTVEVRDYSITYAENVTNRQTNVINLSILGESTTLQASGVIVRSDRRKIWTQAVPKSRLAFAGDVDVRVGGLGWRETIRVKRQGWVVVGNGTAYRVWLRDPNGDWRQIYRSDPVLAEPTLAGTRVAITPGADGFVIELRDTRSTTRLPLPRRNSSVSEAGLTVTNDQGDLIVSYNRTRIRIAKRETYQ